MFFAQFFLYLGLYLENLISEQTVIIMFLGNFPIVNSNFIFMSQTNTNDDNNSKQVMKV